MPDSDAPADRAYRIRLANRLTELRLGIDLGEIRTPMDFENELERDGGFTADDPRVRNACAVAGLGGWLTEDRKPGEHGGPYPKNHDEKYPRKG